MASFDRPLKMFKHLAALLSMMLHTPIEILIDAYRFTAPTRP
jgi:hypothetical protein